MTQGRYLPTVTRRGVMAALATMLAGLTMVGARTPIAAHAAGGGDVPDNAVYLRYQGRGFSIEYVEGWLQTAPARGTQGIIFHDKDSASAVELRPPLPLRQALPAYVQRSDLPALARSPGFARGALAPDSIGGIAALRLSYRGLSAPDDVTGKTAPLQFDRYYVPGPRALAVITLSTPLGVDNVDAFRRIDHSFRFR